MKLDVPLLVAVCLVAAAGFWCVVCRIVAELSGWRRLARSYGCSSLPDGTRLRFQSAGMRRSVKSNYGGCLMIVVNESGMGISVVWLFRVGHEPLFIPWTDITIGQEKLLRLISLVRFNFAAEPGVTMLITPKLMRKMNDAIGRKSVQEIG